MAWMRRTFAGSFGALAGRLALIGAFWRGAHLAQPAYCFRVAFNSKGTWNGDLDTHVLAQQFPILTEEGSERYWRVPSLQG